MKTKKELKEAYKQLKIPMGVFQIKNKATTKVLIDHSIDMASKWNRYRMELTFGSHKNKALQKDWDKYGEANFVFEVLSELKRRDDEAMNYQKELQLLQDFIILELHIENTY